MNDIPGKRAGRLAEVRGEGRSKGLEIRIRVGLAVRGDLHPFLVQSHFLLAMASVIT